MAPQPPRSAAGLLSDSQPVPGVITVAMAAGCLKCRKGVEFWAIDKADATRCLILSGWRRDNNDRWICPECWPKPGRVKPW
jgi:hypothetical protein